MVDRVGLGGRGKRWLLLLLGAVHARQCLMLPCARITGSLVAARFITGFGRTAWFFAIASTIATDLVTEKESSAIALVFLGGGGGGGV